MNRTAQSGGNVGDAAAVDRLVLPRADDFHVHLRQGELMRLVVPLVSAGGIGRCLVMPNTNPPIATTADALAYRDRLMAIEPGIDFLMTLYLTPALTRDEINRAAKAGIQGIKCFPRGATTNSEAGVVDLTEYDDILSAIEAARLVLELHGEIPVGTAQNVTMLNSEQHFLPHLARLHRDFPSLRIVLEHVTTRQGVEMVKALGDTVAATVTAHHLELTADDWADCIHNFCKPVAKNPDDRQALRDVVSEAHPRFFLGSDSAPHPREAKECEAGMAGVFTSALLLPYLADSFDAMGCLERLADFVSVFGRRFYGLPESPETVVLQRREQQVPNSYGSVVPFRAGDKLAWSMLTDS